MSAARGSHVVVRRATPTDAVAVAVVHHGSWVETYRELLPAAHHGTGVGQALLEAVVPPGTPAQLWVAERNPRARRFYERNGFALDGARHVDEDLGIVEIRYVR